MRKEDRERATLEVVCRVLADQLDAARRGGPAVEQVIHDTLYEERKRLEGEPRKNPRRSADLAFIDGLRQSTIAAGEEERSVLLRKLIAHFAEEVVGNFDPRVYKLATSVVPPGMALLLNALSPSRLLSRLPELPHLDSNITVRGAVDTIRRLDELGTVILCPTHLSNLDSPVVGWVLHALGLPPFSYGAGINLFTNPLLSFFMHNLGAYRVDRRKKAGLYKEVLKTYCAVTLELGYNNLFFPGGTRSRSGACEHRLKLGLLGSSVTAFTNNLRHGKDKPNLYIVPCTLSYQLVLEAATLIDDYLKEVGKSRYIIDDDESSRLGASLRFLSNLVSMDSRIYLTISEPLDPFGNRVEADGLSYDRRGRPIDIARYVTRGGEPVHDAARDAEYTSELGEGVLEAYRRDNVLQSTNIAAFTMFSLLRRSAPELSLYRLLRTAGGDGTVHWSELAEATGRVLGRVRQLSADSRLRLDPRLADQGAEGLLEDALRAFGSYHAQPALFRKGDRACTGDLNLLFYYHNRATGYGLEEHIDHRQAPPPLDLARRPGGAPVTSGVPGGRPAAAPAPAPGGSR